MHLLGKSQKVSQRGLHGDVTSSVQFIMDPTKQIPLTWTDPKTGLEWQSQSPGEMTWHQAIEYAASLSLDGKRDWRLPSLAELESLLDRSRERSDGRAMMREEVPFRDELSYWSSTTFENNTTCAWILMFDGAYLLSYYKSNRYHVRCVRGLLNPSPN